MVTARTTRSALRCIERTLIPRAPLAPSSRAPHHLRTIITTNKSISHGNSLSRPFSISTRPLKEAPASSGIAPSKKYTYEEIADLSSSPDPTRILIDVREPSELLATGRIPTAKSVPISSAPDAFFMPAEDFETKFGFARPKEDTEVIFYCKAGVRSRQAALLAGQATPAFGGKVGEYPGSWVDWAGQGGRVEKEGEQGQGEGGVVNQAGAPSTPRP